MWRDLSGPTGPDGPVLVALHVSDDCVFVRITDLCGWYTGTMSRAELEKVLEEESIQKDMRLQGMTMSVPLPLVLPQSIGKHWKTLIQQFRKAR